MNKTKGKKQTQDSRRRLLIFKRNVERRSARGSMRPIKIDPVLNGWLVNVGCQRVVFDDLGKMLAALKSYAQHPNRTERRFLAEAHNDTAACPEVQPGRPANPEPAVLPPSTEGHLR